ncbi:MAG: TetR/AcrR family transcriptional regulator [Deltaproteobacteria bacterium]|nr:TetR/AcrR family transcriptional regulator [Deltaproteobacteria bacterium]
MQRNKRRLLSAALHLFYEKGYEVTTVEDITEQADLGKGTFYRYFDNKTEVWQALQEDSIDRLLNLMHAAKNPPHTIQDVLGVLFDAHSRHFVASPSKFMLTLQGSILGKKQREESAALQQAFDAYVDAIGDHLRPYLPQLLDAAKIRQMTLLVIGLVWGAFSLMLSDMSQEEAKASLKALRRGFVSACQQFLLAGFQDGRVRSPGHQEGAT